MSMVDVSGYPDVVKSLICDQRSRNLLTALSIADQSYSKVASAANAYCDEYLRLRTVAYDEDRNPQDVTEEVPSNNAKAVLVSAVNSIKSDYSRIKTLFDTIFTGDWVTSLIKERIFSDLFPDYDSIISDMEAIVDGN